MNNIYEITISNWEEYNPTHKKNFKKFMFYNGFFGDSKVSQLNQMEVIIYINLLCMRSECSQESFTIHNKSLPKQYRIGDKSLQNTLDRLESLQLLRYSKTLPNRIELKIKEEKLIERIPSRSKPDPKSKELNQRIWAAYNSAYLARYKVEPVRNASVNAKISQLGKRLGDDAVEVVKFYLTHQDSFYLKNLHSIGLCLSNAEALHTQFLRGKAITGNDVRQFEKQNHYADQAARIKAGEL